jgi:hypothetical protein
MHNPPLRLLRAIQKALRSNQASTGAQSGGHGHLFHNGATGSLHPPIIPALNNQGGVGKHRWETGIVDIVIPMYGFYAKGDNVVLFVDDAYVDEQTVRDTNEQLVFAAPVRAFKPSTGAPGYEADVHYHTIDQLGGNETASRSAWLPVKLTVPGDPREDLPAGTVVNERLSAPEGIPVTISPVPGAHLPVRIPPYRYMAAGDVITLFWAGAAIPHPPLTAEQVGSSIITIDVPDTIIAAWPGDAREVRYSIRDRVQNYSLFSPSAYSDVAEQATLAAPLLIGQLGDQFNPDSLAGGAALITVPGTDLQPDDNVIVHFVGQPLDWPYLHHITEAQRFEGASLTFSVPNPLIRGLAGSTLNLYYQVQRADIPLRSYGRLVQIVGTPLELPAPWMPDVIGDQVIPPQGATSIDIIIPTNIALAPGTSVELRWRGVDGAGDDRSHGMIQPVLNHGAAMTFRAPITWAQEIAGGTLEVSYALLAGGLAYASEVLRHSVAGDESLLPAPGFAPPLNQADQLDLDSFTGLFAATIALDNPAFAGGTAHLSWTGFSAAQVISVPIPITPTTLTLPIDRARLIEPNLDQNVAVSYQIQRTDGQLARSKTIVLSVIDSASLRWLKPQIVDDGGQPVSVLAPVREISAGLWKHNSATVVVTDARLRAGDTVDVFWKLISGYYPAIPQAIAENGLARVTVPQQVVAESFGTAVQITYLATVSGTPAPLGEELELIVASAPKTAFPAPVWVESDNGTSLDLNTFTGAATVRVARYPFMAVSQSFWLWTHSRRDDSSPWSMRLGHPPFIVTQADVSSGYLQRSVDRALLLRLEDQADIILTLKAGLSGSSDEHKAFEFNSAALRFAQLRLGLLTPLVERLADNGSVEIHGTSGTLKITARYSPLPGQLIQMVWQGPGAQPPVLLPANARPMPGSLEFAMPNERAAQYDGDTVQISYRVARIEGAAWESSAPVSVNVIALPDPQTEDFSTETPRLIQSETTETLRFFSVSVWGQTTYIEQNNLQSPLLNGRVLRTFANSGWTFTLHRPAMQVTFDLDASNANNIQVIYTLQTGQTVQQTYRTPLHIVFADPAGAQRIISISFSAGMYNNMYIDNITLDYF